MTETNNLGHSLQLISNQLHSDGVYQWAQGEEEGQDECRTTTGGDTHQAFAAEEEDITSELQEEAVCPDKEQADILRRESRGRRYSSSQCLENC